MIRDTFLRRARVARGLTIEDVAAQTRISPRLVTLLDDGRFDELPGGLYARSYVKAFAAATGIDAEAAVARVERLLPGVPDPVSAIRGAIGCPADTPALAADLERIWSAVRSRACAGLVRSNATPFRVIAGPELIQGAGEAVAALCAVTWALYYVLLAGVGTHTAGTWIFGSSRAPVRRPISLAAIFRNAALTWFDQASIVVDVALYADPAPVKSLLARLEITRRHAA
jgi:hypothetical protein